MKLLFVWVAAALIASASSAQQQPRTVPRVPRIPPAAMRALQTQVMLDRAGYSPGEIDGAMGTNTKNALAAFQKGGGDASALPSDAIVSYRITDEDAAGPFTPDIPDDLVEQSKLDSLGYRDLLELLGERFHCSPALLRRLNPNAQFTAGAEIVVPNVQGTIDPTRPPQDGETPPRQNGVDVTLTVTRSTSTLVVADEGGTTIFFAPVTTGSEHDPLPIGNWKVTGVQHDPSFHYNPELFWDADPKNTKAVIKPGPNNPVGVVWIDIDRPHYGLHGTPEPSQIGKTTSHGCVRLTNWDALRVASFVHPGTRVVFAQ
ncbi:MAG TPA: L,D-transpeptidase [Vicinamibacterales bacterium]|jgi:lipoprotein-anchoring transpeptidase ErfK/SrfK|nr:L,D-transpeptidase [Vicinamibacterales bacterium]